jgi:hypothetical protein
VGSHRSGSDDVKTAEAEAETEVDSRVGDPDWNPATHSMMFSTVTICMKSAVTCR